MKKWFDDNWGYIFIFALVALVFACLFLPMLLYIAKDLWIAVLS